MNDCTPRKNTDRKLWQDPAGGEFADSIHVTETGGIGINVGGRVLVAPIQEWHAAMLFRQLQMPSPPQTRPEADQ
jgi:hypothetical protein